MFVVGEGPQQVQLNLLGSGRELQPRVVVAQQGLQLGNRSFKPVFQIRDILIRSWIRILGSLQLITDPNPALIILHVVGQQGLQLGTDLLDESSGSVTY
jgi:hypothetical protein